MTGQLSSTILNCELLTPAFIGGSDARSAELRVPSIKGALRFWWRAFHGDLPINKLKESEAEIFGGTGKRHGQSQVIISMGNSCLQSSMTNFPFHPITVHKNNRSFKINILEYLAYGTYEWKKGKGNEFIREYLEPGTFQLKLLYSNQYWHDIKTAFTLLANFGGLGSRSRNGFGSFTIKGSQFNSDPVSLLNSIDKPSGKMAYTALSTSLKLYRTRERHPTWDGALAEIGKIYRSARSSLQSNEKRKYVAAPLSGKKFIERRAKPYFMHIAKVNSEFEGRLLFLPAAFCAGRKDRNIAHEEVDRKSSQVWAELNDYFSRKLEVLV